MSEELNRIVRDALAARGSALYRSRVARGPRTPRTPRAERGPDGAVDFSSNDYLGLARHPKVVEAMVRGAQIWGAGSAASPLITGFTEVHRSAEGTIARWKGTESAVLLPSGYQANHAAIGALVGAAEGSGRSVRFYFDKLVHASLIDAIVGSGKPFRSFGHNDVGRLERLLEGANDVEMRVVVTESIFSMDGDAADLRGIVALKKKFGFVLVVDEAHGSGVYGPGGSGYAAEVGVSADVDVFIVTLSKAVGCAGGAVCGSKEVGEAVVNFGRAYIYSTAISPGVAAACEAAIGVMAAEPQRQARVRELAKRVRGELAKAGWAIPAGDSPVIPVIVGDEEGTLALAERLRERGLMVMAVRPPTVGRGSSRLRVTLSAGHSDEEVGRLIEELVRLRRGE